MRVVIETKRKKHTKRVRKNMKRKGMNKRRTLRRVLHGGSASGVTSSIHPPDSIKNYITHVVYINLDSREDRKKDMEDQLKVFNKEQITRVSAVKDNKYPYIGCLKSHRDVLTLAKEKAWDNVLILEDDVHWQNIDKSYSIFEELVNKPYDVIMLGGTFPKFDDHTKKIFEAKAASAYLVKKSYYDTIINKINDILRYFDSELYSDKPINKEESANIHKKVAYDEAVYFPLQKADSWYLVYPPLMMQKNSFSDIEGQEVAYDKLYTKVNV